MIKTLTLKQLLATALITVASFSQAQDYLAIQGRMSNVDFRLESGPVTPNYALGTNDVLWFSPDNDAYSNPSTGAIGVKASYSNEKYLNTTDEALGNPQQSMMFGATRSTTAKLVNPKDLLVPMSDIETNAGFYMPTESITDMSPTKYYAIEQFISVEELQNQSLPTDGTYYMGDVTYTFTKPVDNPILHITGLGGGYADGTLLVTQLWSLDYELVASPNVTGIRKLDGTSHTVLEDNTIKSNWTYSDFLNTRRPGESGDDAGTGSFVIEGTNITSVTFKLNIRGKVAETIWSTPDSYDPAGMADVQQQFTGERFNTTWTLPLYDFGGSVVIDFDQNGTPGPDMPIDPNNGGTVVGPYTNLNAGDLYTPLYAVLVDGQGDVAQVSPVSETNGTFDFDGVLGDDYKVLLSTTEPTIGDVAPSSATLGTGWQSTEEQFSPGGAADLNPDSVTEAFNVNASTESQITDNNLILGIKNLNLLVPVELISFEGIANGDDADLTWVTITENNNSHFEIERSFDGANFVKIGEVEGNGTTDVESNYSFTDVGVGEDATVVYYKLKQVDFDGSFEYSKVIVRVEFDANPIETSIYPNPVNQGGDVQVEAQNIETIEVYSVEGQLMNMYEVNGAQVFTINTTDLATGVYFVKVNGLEAMKLIVK